MTAIAATAADRLERVLAQLDGVRQYSDYYKAHCPNGAGHKRGDRNRSLSIRPMPDGGIGLKCFADCAHDQIVAAAGIDRADLRGDGTQSFAAPRTFKPRAAPVQPSKRDTCHGSAPRRVRRLAAMAYPVKDVDGTLIATKRREDWRLADGTIDKSCWWEPKLSALGLAVEDVPLFGSENLKSLPLGSTVAVVEGEKAAQALLDAGIPALGTVTGAATTPSPASLTVLTGYDPVVWPDHDDAGRDHMTAIASRLAELDTGCRWFDWRDAPEKGDAADWLQANVGDGCALPILRALLHNAPTWAPPVQVSTDLAPPGEIARKAALADEIERFLHSHLDVKPSDQLATIEAGFAANARERLGDRDTIYLPDAGIAARTGIHRNTVARTRVSVWQRAGITSHTGPPPADLVGKVKDYDGNYIALPAGHAPAGARLIATCRVNLPAKPEHKAKGVPRAVPLREVLPETIELCDVCPPETPLRVQIVCTGCGQLCSDQTHICGDTRQTMHSISAWVKNDREMLPGQTTMHKMSARFESTRRVAQRRHALASLDPVLPPRDGLVMPELVEPSEAQAHGRALLTIDAVPEAKASGRTLLDIEMDVENVATSRPFTGAGTCALCPAPATHWTGHRPPLHVCKPCLMSPIPADDTGRALIVGTATYTAEHRSAADD